MRIIGEIPHPQLKITVFQMNNKLSVQFESGMYAQIYRIREQEELRSIGDIHQFVDAEMTQAVLAEFGRMHQIQNQALNRFLPADEAEEFDEII